ncbi:MAG: envelope stress response membrane protein PspC [Xanthomonadales bacterium]|nr:envelope stress response membrane protein PspC [Xanthomonadales bacterium]
MSEFRQRANPHRLYRDRDNAVIAGVCAGLAHYFGLNRKGLRLITVLFAIPFFPFVLISYIVLTLILPVKPETKQPKDEAREEFWRDVSNAPSDVFGNVRHRFRELEIRLQRLEAFVTSKEFEIDRELGRTRLGGGRTES